MDGVVYWLEHVGEKIVNKYITNIEVSFVGYLFVVDLIKAREMEHTKIDVITWFFF